jgi:hypothetical protein
MGFENRDRREGREFGGSGVQLHPTQASRLHPAHAQVGVEFQMKIISCYPVLPQTSVARHKTPPSFQFLSPRFHRYYYIATRPGRTDDPLNLVSHDVE